MYGLHIAATLFNYCLSRSFVCAVYLRILCGVWQRPMQQPPVIRVGTCLTAGARRISLASVSHLYSSIGRRCTSVPGPATHGWTAHNECNIHLSWRRVRRQCLLHYVRPY